MEEVMEQENNSLFSQARHFEGKKARIKCIGVGGGGGNAINYMMEEGRGLEDVDFIAVNTDVQVLSKNKAPFLLQVGEKITKGLGVGGDPKIGKKAAEESTDQLSMIVADTDLLFITTGMGGGTGTGVAPEIARIAKETYGDNILIVGVVTRPFKFEGFMRCEHAEEGIKDMEKYADSMIIIPNDKLMENVDAQTDSDAAFAMADEVLFQAVKGISEVILRPGKINIDYNDLKAIMLKSGPAIIGIGEASGPNRHLIALQKAISSPLVQDANIAGSRGALVLFTSAEKIPIIEQGEVMNQISQFVQKRSFVKFGYACDSSMAPDTIKVTLIATGFARAGQPSLAMRPLNAAEITSSHIPFPLKNNIAPASPALSQPSQTASAAQAAAGSSSQGGFFARHFGSQKPQKKAASAAEVMKNRAANGVGIRAAAPAREEEKDDIGIDSDFMLIPAFIRRKREGK